jgi:CelD/BcsL family acetyltransferase involved in cellulose biosynthesis
MSPEAESGLDFQVIRDVAGLEALRPAWLELWRRLPEATPFQSPAWLIPWWQAFGEGDLLAYALRFEGRLVGFVSLYIYAGVDPRKLLPVGIGISDYLDPLLEPAHAIAGMVAVLARLAREQHRFDWCDLACQREGSPWLTAPLPPGWHRRTHDDEPCAVLTLPEVGRPALSGHRRNRLRRYGRRAAAVGETRFELAGPEELTPFMAALAELHGARWRERGEAGVLADPRVRAFHGLALPALLAQGTLRLHGLRIGGRLAAVVHAMADATRVHVYLSGFDPALPQVSPGTLLIGRIIEEAARTGRREVHFLRGREAYKQAWGATPRPSYGLRLSCAS